MNSINLKPASFEMDPTTAVMEITEEDPEGLHINIEDEFAENSERNDSGIGTPAIRSVNLLGGDASITETKVRRKPIPRKGHKKSRRGCYSCKRRKVKCPETKPACENCVKIGVKCEYPQPADGQVVLAAPSAPLSTSPGTFTMNDMRFFHHFLVRGYPHLPVGAEQTWTMEMPAIAHQYDYLMKAMLALGASHLGLSIQDDLHQQALAHRVDAVKSLNKALSRPATSKEEADARFATFMVLTFQSTCMPEGLTDFLTMLRGCVLNGDLGDDSSFNRFTKNRHLRVVIDKISNKDIPSLDTKTLGEAVSSLAGIEPLCTTDTEKRYHGILMDVAVKGYHSPKEAYQSFVQLYSFMGEISHGDFQSFIDPENPVSLLLQSHFIAAHVLLRHISIYEMDSHRTRSNPSPMYLVMLGWTDRIHAALPVEYQAYNEWPRTFVAKWARIIYDVKTAPSSIATDRFLITRTGEI